VFLVERPANAGPGFDGVSTAFEDDSAAFVTLVDGEEGLRVLRDSGVAGRWASKIIGLRPVRCGRFDARLVDVGKRIV